MWFGRGFVGRAGDFILDRRNGVLEGLLLIGCQPGLVRQDLQVAECFRVVVGFDRRHRVIDQGLHGWFGRLETAPQLGSAHRALVTAAGDGQ